MGRDERESAGIAARLDRLRGFRVRPAAELGIAGLVADLRGRVKKQTRAEAEAERAWGAVAPAGVRELGTVDGVRGGRAGPMVVVRVADRGAQFRVTRWLKSGGEARVVGEMRAAAKGVRVVVGELGAQA